VPNSKNIEQPKFKDTVYEDENPETWFHSIPGGLTISAAVILIAIPIFTYLHMKFPPANSPDLTIYVAVLILYLIISAGVLVLSMVITSRIFDGIYFGYLGPLFWKSLLIVLLYTSIAFIPAHSYRFSLFLQYTVPCICLMLFFLRYETALLGFVDFLLLMGIRFALFALLL